MNEDSIPNLVEAFDDYRINRNIAGKDLCSRLDEFSKALAKDQALRLTLVSAFPSIWTDVSNLWDAVLSESLEEGLHSHELMLSLSRFMRNLVAGVPSNQNAAFLNEPKIRRILHHLTAFSQLKDISLYPLTRMLVQTISNLVTLNDVLITRLWTFYTTLPEEQNILTRLISSPDTRTVIATLVLVLNCINAEEAHVTRLTSPIGMRIIVQLLDRTEEWVAQDGESGAESEAFTMAYRIFEVLLKQNLAATLYHSLSMEGEPVTPHQTTFLKILDSSLQGQDGLPDSPQNDYSFLPKSFVALSSYSQRAMRRFLGIEFSPPPHPTGIEQYPLVEDLKELDLRLPKVSASLILLAQCLTTICLKDQKAHEARSQIESVSGYDVVVAATQAEGFIEDLVETLQLVDLFLPRIVFGKAVLAPGERDLPPENPVDTTGFEYLKRDLVRLLGTICHERKEIQDRIRECGGIQVVMNLCVIDERNPYLQEHALFALRNILHHNLENQGIIDAMKPEGT